MIANPKIIGLTGNIGAGKGLVAEALKKQGIPVFNLDEIGRELIVTDTSVQTQLRILYGMEVAPAGKPDFKKMREALFASKKLREKVEAFLHPLIWEKFEEKKAVLRGIKVVVCEAALLVERQHHKRFDGLIVVSAPERKRIQRVMERDKISEDLVRQIIKNQMSDAEKEKEATYLLVNDGTKEELEKKTNTLAKYLMIS